MGVHWTVRAVVAAEVGFQAQPVIDIAHEGYFEAAGFGKSVAIQQ